METGGKGGNANSRTFVGNVKVFESSGKDGEAGENCGKVNINNTIQVYVYGGDGGNGGKANNSNSGTGGGGYPAAGIGRWRSRRWPAVTMQMEEVDFRLDQIKMWLFGNQSYNGIWDNTTKRGYGSPRRGLLFSEPMLTMRFQVAL